MQIQVSIYMQSKHGVMRKQIHWWRIHKTHNVIETAKYKIHNTYNYLFYNNLTKRSAYHRITETRPIASAGMIMLIRVGSQLLRLG